MDEKIRKLARDVAQGATPSETAAYHMALLRHGQKLPVKASRSKMAQEGYRVRVHHVDDDHGPLTCPFGPYTAARPGSHQAPCWYYTMEHRGLVAGLYRTNILYHRALQPDWSCSHKHKTMRLAWECAKRHFYAQHVRAVLGK